MSTLLETAPTPAESVHTEEVLALLARQFGESATVGAVFGSPIVVGERTVIPVARVSYGFGGGGTQAAPGHASHLVREAGEVSTPAVTGAGSGGGGGLRVEPLAVVEITPRRVRIRPIVDVNRLIGRVFTTVFGFALATLALRAFVDSHPNPPRPLPSPKALPLLDQIRARISA